ncbi:MAG: winged helix-turn-helix domain-containing protein, partial [Candidatus Ranarchaeia archaeon]
MPIPDFQSIMLPLLELLRDRQEYSYREVIEKLAKFFELTKEEKQEKFPKGNEKVFNNKVGWAIFHTKKAQLIKSTQRSYIKINKQGRQLLKQKP